MQQNMDVALTDSLCSILVLFGSDFVTINTAAERIQRPTGKRECRGALRAKRAETCQGLEINIGKLLLVYFMRPPDLEALGVLRPLGACGPGAICPLSPSQ